MTVKLHYLFDPLCGWCYGASGVIGALGWHPAIDLRPWATGLFAGSGARPMKSFAAQAWTADQRIGALSGQVFSEAYRRDVLGAADASLDSTISTLAVTAVADTTPERVVEALSAIQATRYVKGRDVTSPVTVAKLLQDLGLMEEAARITSPDAALVQLANDRAATAHRMMQEFRLQGVPALIAEAAGQRRVLDLGLLYSGAEAVLSALKLA